MDQYISLTYHQATLDLIHERPLVSAHAIEILDQLERRRQLSLPASVQEWYSLKRAVERLNSYPSGIARDVEHLGMVDRYWSGGRYHEIDLFQKGLLPIMVEIQGVCTWAIQLDGTNDPPVVVSFDNTMPFAKWELCAETFSRFVYTCVWDGQVINPEDQMFGWKHKLLSTELAFFREYFQEGPQTYTFPGRINYRFFSGSQRILIQEGENGTSLYFFAPSDEELKHLVETVLQSETLKRDMRLDRNGTTKWELMFPDDDW